MGKIKNGIKKMRDIWHSDLMARPNDLLVTSLISYCQNQFLGETAKSLDMYKYISEVHTLTKIHDIITPGVEKIRIGNDHDGGYIMVKPYSRKKIAYSFGINRDVSWDLQMAGESYQIYQYDHTITRLPEQNEAFHWKKLGLTGTSETKSLKTLKTLIRENGHENESGMVLKMDIEGYEWDVFANADTDTLGQFDQISVEFHDLLNIDMINKHLQAFRQLAESFVAVHVHANNFGNIYYCGDLLMPSVLELTFVKRNLFEVVPSAATFPTFLDSPNNAYNFDYMIGKW